MKLQLAKGCADVPPQEKLVMNALVELISSTYEKYGFAPYETPVLERFETLAAKFGAGEESDALQETFKLSDQGERKLGLRFEFTTSLARFVAQNAMMKLPLKCYQVGPNFRDGPIKLGRSRQFWQCDADVIGSKSMLADSELIAMLCEVFTSLEFDYEVVVNNRKILNGMLAQCSIKDVSNALIALDKLDKIGEDGVRKELLERGISDENIDALFMLISSATSLEELSSKLTDDQGKEGLSELGEVFSSLKELSCDERVRFDVSLARGQAYYTGTIVEVYLKKGKVTSSLAGGGRYDKMIGGFLGGKREIPAVGVSFGILPIMEALKKEGEFTRRSPADVLVVSLNTQSDALRITQELRLAGIYCDFSFFTKGLTKSLSYADAVGIPRVLIIGEKELAEKKVLLRDMQSGDEKLLSVKKVIEELTCN